MTDLARCTIATAVESSDPAFTHTWRLLMPCGMWTKSHAALPPVTVACGRVCDIQQPRPVRQEFDF